MKRMLCYLLILISSLCAWVQGYTQKDTSVDPVDLPVVMYHHIADQEGNAYIVSYERFQEQLSAIQAAGFHTVTLEQIYAFVYNGTPLPEKPVLITFDDGYESNYLLAYPLLKSMDMRAVVFTIGVSVGKDTYKDTGVPITPHFSLEQAAEMAASGYISIQAHGYNIHEVAGLDPAPIRRGILKRDEETDAEYDAFLTQDLATLRRILEPATGKTITAFAYPGGLYSQQALDILKREGILCTFTTEAHINTLIPGDPECLINLGRFNADPALSGQALVALLSGESD